MEREECINSVAMVSRRIGQYSNNNNYNNNNNNNNISHLCSAFQSSQRRYTAMALCHTSVGRSAVTLSSSSLWKERNRIS